MMPAKCALLEAPDQHADRRAEREAAGEQRLDRHDQRSGHQEQQHDRAERDDQDRPRRAARAANPRSRRCARRCRSPSAGSRRRGRAVGADVCTTSMPSVGVDAHHRAPAVAARQGSATDSTCVKLRHRAAQDSASASVSVTRATRGLVASGNCSASCRETVLLDDARNRVDAGVGQAQAEQRAAHGEQREHAAERDQRRMALHAAGSASRRSPRRARCRRSG